MKVLGVDPGLAVTGYGIIEGNGRCQKSITYGCINTDSHQLVEERLLVIYGEITALINEYNPDVLVLEEVFFNKNARSVLKVGEARGVVLLAAASNGLPVFEYTPLQVKQGVAGYGRATKAQIRFMVRVILGLSQEPKPDDTADALAIALCHLQSHRMNRVIRGERSK